MASEPWILLQLCVFERKKAGLCYSCTFWTQTIPNKTQKAIFPNPVWRVFWRQFATFSEVVFGCVFMTFFFRLRGDLWAAQGDRKGAKMEPKVIEKAVRRHLVEHAKTMAGAVREAYGEVPGRVQEAPFSECGAKDSP